jgi:SAM-dependent methyltransferase
VATDLRHGEWLGRPPVVGAGTTNSDHRVLAQVFDGRVRDRDVLVDLGCGRGRVLSTWLRAYPGRRIIGVEIDPKLASRTGRRFAGRADCLVVQGDAVTALPPEGTLFYMFNPFDRPTVERLRDALEARAPSDPPLRILYSNPRHADLFERRPGWTVAWFRLGGGHLVPHHDLVVIDQGRGASRADSEDGR